jgi:uncharacterized protein (DUF697 family)
MRLRNILLAPRVDEAALARALREAAVHHPPPVLWLLGKTQSGKTSIIRALTGSPEAAIGAGFQSCTRTARFYDFPDPTPVVRFLDTRGLGEVAYDPAEDIRFCESQAHLIIAVVKVSDILQQVVYDVLRDVRRRHPDWPVVIAQTCLHEAYAPAGGHIRPYPFDQAGWETAVPAVLARAIIAQRRELELLPGPGTLLWVPIDLTQPEEGIDPSDYGLEALWDAIETGATFGLQAMLRGDAGVRDLYDRAAHPQIVGYAAAAGALGAMPMVDMTLVPALQMKMLHSLARLYQLTWTRRTSSEFFGLLGAGFMAGYGLRWAGRGVIKLIPGLGQTLGAVWGATAGAAITFALGKAACFYLEKSGQGLAVDSDALRAVYARAFARSRSLTRPPGPKEPQP